MSLLTINQDVCAKDGICVAECPAQIITMEGEGFPSVSEANEVYCINCGHCVAVCRQGALSMKGLLPTECLPVSKEMELSQIHVEHFLRSRRSIRAYREAAVEKERLAKAIDIARHAPTGSNKQPVKWMVIYQRDDVIKIANGVLDWMKHMRDTAPEVAAGMNLDRIISMQESGNDRICRGAPHLIFAYADKANGSATVDSSTALGYLELALPSLGLGSCWAGYVNYAARFWPPLKEALNLPENHDVQGVLMVGYPKHRYYRMPPRNEPSILWR